ncbi:hypothetical protein ACFOGG_02210 [Brenneria rubrifaciens]|uniref:hypothetical protein n=1 Tax=Brenneria rubrifaciens TaxID=55213 RepID=UPI00361CF7EF
MIISTVHRAFVLSELEETLRKVIFEPSASSAVQTLPGAVSLNVAPPVSDCA